MSLTKRRLSSRRRRLSLKRSISHKSNLKRRQGDFDDYDSEVEIYDGSFDSVEEEDNSSDCDYDPSVRPTYLIFR